MAKDFAGAPKANRRPKGDSYYDNVARNYEKRRRKQDWWQVEQDAMRDLLSGLPKGLSVVDIPFGTGRFVPFYREFGYRVAGLDSSPHMIQAAREALGPLFDGADVRIGDAGALPFGDGEFDLLVSTRFLRDIITFDHARRVLAEFARITSKYAIIQLGEAVQGNRMPTADETMGGSMSAAAVDALLAEHGLRAVDRRLVKEIPEEGSVIHHILCERG